MKRIIIFLFLLSSLSGYAQFADTAALNAYLRENIRDKRPDKVTADQLRNGMLGISSFLLQGASFYDSTLMLSKYSSDTAKRKLRDSILFTLNSGLINPKYGPSSFGNVNSFSRVHGEGTTWANTVTFGNGTSDKAINLISLFNSSGTDVSKGYLKLDQNGTDMGYQSIFSDDNSKLSLNTSGFQMQKSASSGNLNLMGFGNTFTFLANQGDNSMSALFGGDGISFNYSDEDARSVALSLTGDNGFKITTNGVDRLNIGINGDWKLISGNSGDAGQVLTSQGEDAAPIWADVNEILSEVGGLDLGIGSKILVDSIRSRTLYLGKASLFNDILVRASNIYTINDTINPVNSKRGITAQCRTGFTSAPPSVYFSYGGDFEAIIKAENNQNWNNQIHPVIAGVSSQVYGLSGATGIIPKAATYYGTCAINTGLTVDEYNLIDITYQHTGTLNHSNGIRIADIDAGTNGIGIYNVLGDGKLCPNGQWFLYDSTAYKSHFAGLLETGGLDNYLTDLSGSYTSRSKVDSAFVGRLTLSALSFSQGLTKIGSSVNLGGNRTTGVNLSSNNGSNFIIGTTGTNDTYLDIEPGATGISLNSQSGATNRIGISEVDGRGMVILRSQVNGGSPGITSELDIDSAGIRAVNTPTILSTAALNSTTSLKVLGDNNKSNPIAEFQDHSGNVQMSIGQTANTEGGQGYLNIINPTDDAAGCGFKFVSGAGSKTGLFQMDRDGAMVFRNYNNGGMYFDAQGSSDVHFRTSDSRNEVFTILNSGFVGVGVSNPTQALDVNGIINTNNGIHINTGLDPEYAFQTSGDGRMLLSDVTNSTSFFAYESATQKIYLGSQDINPVTINGLNGFLGIGNTSPAKALDVNGEVKIATINNSTDSTDKVIVSHGGVLEAANFRYGTYTPTITNGSNITSTTAYPCQFMVVGNVVTVSGRFDYSYTAVNLATDINMSLPISTTISNRENLGGSGYSNRGNENPAGSAVTGSPCGIRGNTSTNSAFFTLIATAALGTTTQMYFTFTYLIK